MEKSIESIWNKGFINTNFAEVPVINDISNLKSIYFVDRFKSKYKTNMLFLWATGVICLVAFVLGGVPFFGLLLFLMFAVLALMAHKESEKLDRIDMVSSNFEYLKDVNYRIKTIFDRFSFVYRFWLPLFFILFTLATMYSNVCKPFLDYSLIEYLRYCPDTFVAYGVPVFWMVGIGLGAIALSFLSKLVFTYEIRSIYGSLMRRLEQLQKEFEKLES